jgi:hypothetical protein
MLAGATAVFDDCEENSEAVSFELEAAPEAAEDTCDKDSVLEVDAVADDDACEDGEAEFGLEPNTFEDPCEEDCSPAIFDDRPPAVCSVAGL